MALVAFESLDECTDLLPVAHLLGDAQRNVTARELNAAVLQHLGHEKESNIVRRTFPTILHATTV